MKNTIKISDKKMQEYKNHVIKSGKNTISSFQVAFGLSYIDASVVSFTLSKDKKLLALALKEKRERPRKKKAFIKSAIAEIKLIKDKDYVNWKEISAKLNMGFGIGFEVIEYLQEKNYLSNDRVYLIKKNNK